MNFRFHCIKRYPDWFFCSSVFQCICVLGYCVVPLAVSLTLCKIIVISAVQTTGLFVVRSLIVLAGFVWCVFGEYTGVVSYQLVAGNSITVTGEMAGWYDDNDR